MPITVGLSSDISNLEIENQRHKENRSRAADKAEEYRQVSVAIDTILVDRLSGINSAKTDIVSLGGNVGLGSTCYSSDISYLTTTYGDLVTGIGSTFGSVFGITGIGTTQVVGYGTIYYDSLRAYRFPQMESTTGVTTATAATIDPFSGEGFVDLTASNLGVGASVVFFAGVGTAAGTVFSLVNDCHDAVSAAISSYIDAYDSDVSGISSYVGADTLIKNEKKEYQFQYWSLSRQIVDNETGITTTNSVIGVLNDPSIGGPY